MCECAFKPKCPTKRCETCLLDWADIIWQIIDPQPAQARPEPVLETAEQQKCIHLAGKRTCCQELYLCKKYPGESCSPSGAIVGALDCTTCKQYARPGKSHRVGFISAAYMTIGGTETFHRALIPRLKDSVDITGFVATGFFGGDGSLLQVPYLTGMGAAMHIANTCDTVVVWGLDCLREILPKQIPCVIAVHHSDQSSDWTNSQILNQLDLIDEIVCVNEGTAKHIATFGKPTHYIPNAIDPERIKPSGQQEALRGIHGIPAASKIVLFGHRLTEEKRPALAVEIARQLPHDWVMVIVGDGHERPAVEAAAANCDRVRIVGAVESMADWLAISDCFLSLSTLEGFGLSIGEAMAAGVPTVSTPAGIAPGLATTLPTDSTAKEWADAIVTAKRTVEPAVILDRFSVQRMVDSWASILKTITQAKE